MSLYSLFCFTLILLQCCVYLAYSALKSINKLKFIVSLFLALFYLIAYLSGCCSSSR